MYKIAIAGASTLLGKELKEALSDSPLAAANFALLDEDEALGQLGPGGRRSHVCSGHSSRTPSSGRTLLSFAARPS